MHKKYILVSILLLASIQLFGQKSFKGMIMDKSLPKGNMGVEGVEVFWLGTSVSATTNSKGWFKIPYKKEYKKLVISHIGFKQDTLTIKNPLKEIHHFLTEDDNTLGEVVIKSKRKAVHKSLFKTANLVNIGSDELLKAACCNLSESFETDPNIDTNFTDALTGVKQIQMLGLTSPYLLINTENIPSVRGASQVYGMSFIPGTWIESIQVSKGAGSVVNGYQSITGQINAELVKPMNDKPFFLNGFASMNGRLELNSHINTKLSDKLATGFYIHSNARFVKNDRNKDGFLDNPLTKQYHVMNRWKYSNPEKGWMSSLNISYLEDNKQTGQTKFNPKKDKGSSTIWGSEIKTKYFKSSGKLGYIFPDSPFQSIGFQVSFDDYRQNSYFGLQNFDIQQQSVFSNLIFNSIIGDTRHKFKTGLNFLHDNYTEFVNHEDFSRKETSAGAFFEYAYNNDEDFSLTAGLRGDYHNLIGFFVTPRLHLRYVPWENSALRASVGKGVRVASIFAENQQLFSSSRQLILENPTNKMYGLQPEKAWNYGVSFLQKFKLFGKNSDFSVDFYQTNFENQVVVDWENFNEVSFYNLNGKSIANSFQAEFNIELYKNIELKTAYKYYDVTTDYKKGKLTKPLQPKHRLFANFSAESTKTAQNSQWKMNVTYNFNGKQRLPNTNGILSEHSKSFHLLNAQFTRVFSKHFEWYVGAENITDYTQKRPILGAENPFGANFDSTIIYAPIFGRGFYTGFRLNY